MKIILVDYGIGNLRSVRKTLERVGAAVIQTDDPKLLLSGDKVVLPGVGAFKDGMAGLQHRGMIPVLNQVVDQKIPLLGICLGMQVLFARSSEMGHSPGLGFVEGEVKKFSMVGLKIPHTGWNQLHFTASSPLFQGVKDDAYVYFNHSFYCSQTEPSSAIAHTDYGVVFTSAIQSGSIYGVQFHPEKSQETGLTILKNFVELCE